MSIHIYLKSHHSGLSIAVVLFFMVFACEERFFPVLPVVSSGRELIEFLNLNNQVEPPSNLAFFYQQLKEGGCLSASGRSFAGGYHCEAYIASLLTSLERDVKDFKEGLDTPDIEGICRIDEVLENFKAGHFSCIT